MEIEQPSQEVSKGCLVTIRALSNKQLTTICGRSLRVKHVVYMVIFALMCFIVFVVVYINVNASDLDASDAKQLQDNNTMPTTTENLSVETDTVESNNTMPTTTENLSVETDTVERCLVDGNCTKSGLVTVIPNSNSLSDLFTLTNITIQHTIHYFCMQYPYAGKDCILTERGEELSKNDCQLNEFECKNVSSYSYSRSYLGHILFP